MKTVAALPRVIGISLLVAGITYSCTFLVKRTYQSDEVLYFPQAQGSSNPLDMLKGGGGGGDASTVSLLGGTLLSPLVAAGPQTASGIITSRTAIRNCVDLLSLDQAWGVSKNEAYERLSKWTDAKVDKNGMLSVSATAESPEQAVTILKNLESYLSKRSDELTLNVSRSNRVYLEKRVAAAGKEVNKIQNQLVDTMKSSPLADVDTLMKSYFTVREDLQKAEVAEAAAESKLAVLEADAKRMASGGKGFPNNVVALGSMNTDLTKLSEEIQSRQVALEDAITNFTVDSPEYRTAVRQAKNAEKVSDSVAKASQQAVQQGLTPELIQARSDLSALKSATARYSKLISNFDSSVLKAPGQFAAVSRIKLEFNDAMTSYGLLRQQLEMARLAESRDPSRFAVLDEPYPNPKPIGPRRGLITAIAFVLAGLLQLALHSLKEDADEDDALPPLSGPRRREIPSDEAVAMTEVPRKMPIER
jgi:uncharacterized protein involved in exopolysaccharide biosynthesis